MKWIDFFRKQKTFFVECDMNRIHIFSQDRTKDFEYIRDSNMAENF